MLQYVRDKKRSEDFDIEVVCLLCRVCADLVCAPMLLPWKLQRVFSLKTWCHCLEPDWTAESSGHATHHTSSMEICWPSVVVVATRVENPQRGDLER